MRHIILSFLLLVQFSLTIFADTVIKANPDFFSSGMSWTTEGIPSVKVGDVISLNRYSIGGMLEARNEKRFNQEILPNHNWRGLGTIEAALYNRQMTSSRLTVFADVSHESAHPTMCIREPTEKACELIYDDSYRRMILNSISVSGFFSRSFTSASISARVDYHFYFLSKNTPELSGSKLGAGNGFSAGAESRYRIGRSCGVFISIFDRYVFSGPSTEGYVYRGSGASLEQVLITYPVIAQTNTIVLKTGLSLIFDASRREAIMYGRILYGNPFGFIDSRDKRLMLSLGFEFSL